MGFLGTVTDFIRFQEITRDCSIFLRIFKEFPIIFTGFQRFPGISFDFNKCSRDSNICQAISWFNEIHDI